MRFKLQSENQYSTPADPGISQAAGGVGILDSLPGVYS